VNNRILFMVIGNEVKYLQNSTMDHREWYLSLGYDPNQFDNLVRGFIEKDRIIFYKGSTFSYDAEVIRAAKMFTSAIRFTCNNPSLQAYCGVSFEVGDKWEPIMKISDDELTGFVKEEKKVEKPVVTVASNNDKPIIELKNNFEDAKFRKTATIVTIVVFVLAVIAKVVLFKQKTVLNSDHFTDVLLTIAQIGTLGLTIFGFIQKKSFAKYSGIVASVLLVFTMDFFDLLLGILYFLFCIDQNIFVKAYQVLQNFIQKVKK